MKLLVCLALAGVISMIINFIHARKLCVGKDVEDREILRNIDYKYELKNKVEL